MIFKICEKNNQILAKNIKKLSIGKYSLVINKFNKSISYRIKKTRKNYTTIKSKMLFNY